ncbi:hypothetical protein GGD81_002919 [Rhodobium orientis]|uniref:hypothetical protein n=1 Tax=Rhodobium orientis TaxID=34017 RepID=UPI0017907DCE|nr:hypothetical protein [Rhodobium orientis]MBB4303867.1 hypothetical protein [Rhodobium orientis]
MSALRRSDVAVGALAAAASLALVAMLHAFVASRTPPASQAVNAALVRDLGLTDLVLFTDARYTRHPSVADLHSAFQDHPMSLDHFPSGSLIAPPRHIFGTGPRFASDEEIPE